MSNVQLTEEQRRRIEANKQAALKKRDELARQRAQAANKPIGQSTNQPNRNLTVSSTTNVGTTNYQPNSSSILPRQTPLNNPINQLNRNQTATNQTANNQTATNQNQHNHNLTATNQNQTNKQTNSNGVHAQAQSSNPTQTFRYSFNRINANAVSNVAQNSRTNQPSVNSTNRPNPPARQPTNNPSASYGSNTASFAIPSTNQPNRLGVNQINNRQPNSIPKNSQNSYITPAKRPAGPNDYQTDKRLKTGPQAKSPYEQVMSKAQTIEIKFYLLNNKEFYLDFRFNQRLIDEIKKLHPVRFHVTKKVWIFKLEKYEELLIQLRGIRLDRLDIKLGEGFPSNVQDILKDSLRYDTIKVNLEMKICPEMLKRLFPYQKEGVIFGVKREGKNAISKIFKSSEFTS